MPTSSTARAPAEGGDPLAPLLTGALEREPQAMRRLLDGVAPDVVRVVKLIVGSDALDLDDLCQEALLGLLRALPEFRGECSIRRFARRVAARTAVTSRRRAARRATHRARFVEREALPASAPGGDAGERRRAVVRELLVELPEAQAEALVLRVVLGHSLDEIASATGAPLNTVRSRLRLAKEALRRRIPREHSAFSTVRPHPPAQTARLRVVPYRASVLRARIHHDPVLRELLEDPE